MRIRILTPVSRDSVISALPKGWWRQAIPRFKPIKICLFAFDGDLKQAEAIAKALAKVPVLGGLFSVTADSTLVLVGWETADGKSPSVPV